MGECVQLPTVYYDAVTRGNLLVNMFRFFKRCDAAPDHRRRGNNRKQVADKQLRNVVCFPPFGNNDGSRITRGESSRGGASAWATRTRQSTNPIEQLAVKYFSRFQ